MKLHLVACVSSVLVVSSIVGCSGAGDSAPAEDGNVGAPSFDRWLKSTHSVELRSELDHDGWRGRIEVPVESNYVPLEFIFVARKGEDISRLQAIRDRDAVVLDATFADARFGGRVAHSEKLAPVPLADVVAAVGGARSADIEPICGRSVYQSAALPATLQGVQGEARFRVLRPQPRTSTSSALIFPADAGCKWTNAGWFYYECNSGTICGTSTQACELAGWVCVKKQTKVDVKVQGSTDGTSGSGSGSGEYKTTYEWVEYKGLNHFSRNMACDFSQDLAFSYCSCVTIPSEIEAANNKCKAAQDKQSPTPNGACDASKAVDPPTAGS